MASVFGNRCHCYNGHNSSSGRCHHKHEDGRKYCDDCVTECCMKESKSLPKSPTEAMFALIETKMKLMDKFDVEVFSGVESERPMIGEYGNITITLDGSSLQFTDTEGDFTVFELVCR